jgi:metal-sulfur cluster biosynthetic enzyme
MEHSMIDPSITPDAPASSLDVPSADEPTVVQEAAAEEAAIPGAFTADQARLVLRRVKDPELNLNIVDLGLIYDVKVVGNDVRVDMSLTSPGCPSGPEIMGEAEKELRTLPGIGEAVVNLVWSPAWTPERIEPRVRAYMGF